MHTTLRDDAFACRLVMRGCELTDQLMVSKSLPNIVLVSILCFLDDELSVKQDETAHDEQPEVHVSLSEDTDTKNYHDSHSS